MIKLRSVHSEQPNLTLADQQSVAIFAMAHTKDELLSAGFPRDANQEQASQEIRTFHVLLVAERR